MADITPEMQLLLDYAEVKNLHLYLTVLGEDYDGWEDCFWGPKELREALKDYPQQSRAGADYPAHSYKDIDINDHLAWKLVDAKDVYKILECESERIIEKGQCKLESARYFKRLWIDRTEVPYWRDKKKHDYE